MSDFGEPWHKAMSGCPTADDEECSLESKSKGGEIIADHITNYYADRILGCINAFAGHDPAECVVVTRKDVENALELIGNAGFDGDEYAFIDRLTAAVEEKP